MNTVIALLERKRSEWDHIESAAQAIDDVLVAVRALAPPGKYNETKFLASLVVALMEDNGENMPDDIRTAAMLYCEAALANAPEESIESVLRRILV